MANPIHGLSGGGVAAAAAAVPVFLTRAATFAADDYHRPRVCACMHGPVRTAPVAVHADRVVRCTLDRRRVLLIHSAGWLASSRRPRQFHIRSADARMDLRGRRAGCTSASTDRYDRRQARARRS